MMWTLTRMVLAAALVSAASAQAQTQKRSRARPAKPASAGFSAEWVGQGPEDRVGTGVAVGPDGVPDAKIVLRKLRPNVEIVGVVVKESTGPQWHSGANPDAMISAELVRRGGEPTTADFFFAPDRDLKGRTLQLAVYYVNGEFDSAKIVAGKFDPKATVSRPKLAAPALLKLRATWIGQDGTDKVGPGDVHVRLEGLPRSPIAAAALNNSSQGLWSVRPNGGVPFDCGPEALPMSLERGTDPSVADLRFPPHRDETGGTMTLRLLFEDGRFAIAQFPGGPADPGLRASFRPASSETTARPGDDLQDLVKRFGTVKLASGAYALSRPLILDKPVRIVGEKGATLTFTQGAGDPTWSAAIKIHSGHTALEGFAVRFGGPIRWTPGVSGGPAVIGTTDSSDPIPGDLKSDLVCRKLDLEGPPAGSNWEETPRLLRLTRAVCGAVEDCTLKGGMIEFENGPWRIVRNRHVGTPSGTYSFAVVAGHRTHDLLVKDNVVRPPADPRAKTWRFLVLTQSGFDDRIEGNQIANVGPRDGDTVPADNAPEIMLTEAYSLHFEGKPLAVSPDGRILAIPTLQGDPVRSGDCVAILSGPHAGQWRRIAQPMGPTTYLLDEPLPPGTAEAAVSIATGFVRERFVKNTIDILGSSGAGGLVLVGNLFGLEVRENHILGGLGPVKITAAPTERPVHWGWSHAPLMGARIEGNVFEDALRGGAIAVEHSPQIKTTKGRVYASLTVSGNVARWSDEFARKHNGKGERRAPSLLLGDPGSLDPGEMQVSEGGMDSGNAPASEIHVVAANVNGKQVRNRTLTPSRTAPSAEKGGSPSR